MKAAVAAGILAFLCLSGWLVWVALHPPQRGESHAVAPESPAATEAGACDAGLACQEEPATLSPGAGESADAHASEGTLLLSSGRPVLATYERTCAACHIAGLAGAPRIGNRDEWAARVSKGMQALYQSALVGLPPGMPAKGLCYDCTAEDLQKLVDYMVANSR